MINYEQKLEIILRLIYKFCENLYVAILYSLHMPFVR